ncbi:hypothetical protein DPX16_20409 [Anabarilius grahami]|uniref:Uncharacterized protein n=1 Tax=Anabarilius grahami TaxID=495550 RepID=A0A3N0XIA2_ANAGA|nr:hypothetical protein DPX16_20409 [Anabarilius grahami]
MPRANAKESTDITEDAGGSMQGADGAASDQGDDIITWRTAPGEITLEIGIPEGSEGTSESSVAQSLREGEFYQRAGG